MQCHMMVSQKRQEITIDHQQWKSKLSAVANYGICYWFIRLRHSDLQSLLNLSFWVGIAANVIQETISISFSFDNYYRLQSCVKTKREHEPYMLVHRVLLSFNISLRFSCTFFTLEMVLYINYNRNFILFYFSTRNKHNLQWFV